MKPIKLSDGYSQPHWSGLKLCEVNLVLRMIAGR